MSSTPEHNRLAIKITRLERQLEKEVENRRSQHRRFLEEREKSVEISGLVSQARNIHDLTQVVTGFIKEWLDMEACGIRLKNGSDYPYYVTKGFPKAFIRLENALCTRNRQGELIRDKAGMVQLECMCGNILSRRFDPSLSFFTEHGSFWTNSTTQLLATTTDEDRQTRTRNQCYKSGYESVALIPLITRNKILGLVQMNDSRPNRFSLDRILMLERIIAQLAHALAEHLAWKDLKLAKERLFQSQKIEAIGLLAGGIAHDFNNILSPIIGLTEMLLEDDLSRENKAFLHEVLNAGTRARELVKQIQTFGRKRITPSSSIAVLPVVKEALTLFKSTLPSSIKLIEKFPNNIGEIDADAIHFHQVIMNLVTNAFHAMEETGGILTINLKRKVLQKDSIPAWGISANEYVCLSIADTGTGISEEDIPKVFEPYFTTKSRNQGTGLGLSMVHSLMRSLSGAITVESRLGEGSKFRVYFPCRKPDTPIVPKVFPVPEDSMQGDERILVVDDEPAVRKVLNVILSRAGYHLLVCGNSPAALGKFSQSPSEFDLVITDLTMPEMMGDRLVREMKKIRPDMQFILCTGIIQQKQKEKLMELGIYRIITKPIDRNILLSTVREMLD